VLTVGTDLEWQVPTWVKAAEHEWGRKVTRQATGALAREGVKVTAEMRTGAPAREIISAAEEIQADLIVVGSQGLSGVSRFLLGSVSNNVARHAGRPVLVGRPAHHHLRHLVLAVDESRHATEAAAFLARLPVPADTEITIVQVVRPFIPYGGMVPTDPSYMLQLEEQVRAQRVAEAEKRVGAVLEQLRAAGKRASSVVRVGNPAAEILAVAGACQADLIVAGARGASLIKGLVVGSVADHLVKCAPCSVLLVHEPVRTADVPAEHPEMRSALRVNGERLVVLAASVPS
jgi:nucleotide-binding universal stress UspA family protein